MAQTYRSPASSPTFKLYREITVADNGGPYIKSAQGATTDGFGRIIVQVTPLTVAGNPTAKVFFWNEALSRFIYSYTASSEAGLGTPSEFVVETFGRVLFVEITGVVTGGVNVHISGSNTSGGSSESPVRVAKSITVGSGAAGVGQTLANSEPITLGPLGLVSVQCIVDNGTEDVAPSDAPVGQLRLYSAASPKFALVDTANVALDGISPTGNNALINKWASFEIVPGSVIKVVYARSGGGGTARIRLVVVVS